MLEKYEHKFLESVIHELKEWREWKLNTDRLLFENEIWKGNIMAQIDELNAAITSLQSQVTALQALPAPVPAPDLAPATSAVQAAADAIGVVVKNQPPTV